MSFPNRNQLNSRSNAKRHASNSFTDGQTGAKRKNPRWTNKPKGSEANFKTFNIDTPLFKTPYDVDVLTPTGRNQNFSYNDNDTYNYNNRRYNSFDAQSYSPRSSLGSPARSTPVQQRPSTSDSRSRRFVEPEHSGPAWYWEKYFYECKNWQDKHKLAYYKSRCMALEFENQMLFEQIKSLIHENGVFSTDRGEVPAMLLPNFPGGLKGFEPSVDKSAEDRSPKNKGKARNTSNGAASDDDSLICDVPDTMLDVIEKSMRHKINLYQKRKAADEEKKEIDKVKKGESENVPKQPRGLKRTEELNQLFGENAPLIQSLETSIQHHFNRSCDTCKPEMYPTVPLNPQAVG